MAPSRSIRLAAAAVLGIAAAVAAWVAEASIEPHLDVELRRQMHTPNYDDYGISVRARGGEMIDEVRVEIVSGPVSPIGDLTFRGLKPGWMKGFRVHLDDPATSTGRVRVVQTARVNRTYDLVLEAGR